MKQSTALSVLMIALSLVGFSHQQINWQGDWAHACDFDGGDIGNILSSGDQCSNQCRANGRCTHYTWTTFDGGRCWMKRGKVTKANARYTGDQVAVCGIVCENCDVEGGGGSGNEWKPGNLAWSDEFNSLGSNWIQETGGGGWGNNELQYYTNNGQNAKINNGFLTIEARKENAGGMRFTSARLISSRTFKYGSFEMRARLPRGRGTWPAFWLLAANRPLNWPSDGEIDIMEHVGYDQNNIVATIHCGRFNHMIGTQIGQTLYVNDVENTFHLYQLTWTSTSIMAFVDGRFYFKYDKPGNSYAEWPFDNSFNIILNSAVGGDWGGALGIDENIWPQRYEIDYVRVYN